MGEGPVTRQDWRGQMNSDIVVSRLRLQTVMSGSLDRERGRATFKVQHQRTDSHNTQSVILEEL